MNGQELQPATSVDTCLSLIDYGLFRVDVFQLGIMIVEEFIEQDAQLTYIGILEVFQVARSIRCSLQSRTNQYVMFPCTTV